MTRALGGMGQAAYTTDTTVITLRVTRVVLDIPPGFPLLLLPTDPDPGDWNDLRVGSFPFVWLVALLARIWKHRLWSWSTGWTVVNQRIVKPTTFHPFRLSDIRDNWQLTKLVGRYAGWISQSCHMHAAGILSMLKWSTSSYRSAFLMSAPWENNFEHNELSWCCKMELSVLVTEWPMDDGSFMTCQRWVIHWKQDKWVKNCHKMRKKYSCSKSWDEERDKKEEVRGKIKGKNTAVNVMLMAVFWYSFKADSNGYNAIHYTRKKRKEQQKSIKSPLKDLWGP